MTSAFCRVFAVSVLILFSLLSLPLAVQAETDYITYPLLPKGYSSIKVYDRHGQLAGRLLNDERYWVTLDHIPVFLQNAVIAIEDSRFYEHGGIDLRGIARALVKDVVEGKLVEGGSTITQQLVKNRHLSSEKTIDRKVKEGLLAMEYEQKYSKQQILEMYFNEIYFGNGAWGIVQAARLYFDKDPEALSDAECAILAGVPKNPSRYNPLGNPVDVVRRRDIILKRMSELELITPQQVHTLQSQPLIIVKPSPVPQYLSQIRRKLIEWYGSRIIARGGLEVSSAMDLDLQLAAEKTLREGTRRFSADMQGALLSLDPRTGDVLALAGGVDFQKSTYNRAFFAQRQPGSAIKPLIYAAAMEVGATASDHWDDSPITYDSGNHQSWTPRNYGGKTYGTQTLHEALVHSNNVIAVKLLDTIGVPYFVDFARKLGLPVHTANDLSLALGTDEVTLLDLTLAYTPLANGGQLAAARMILRIHDLHGDTWREFPPDTTGVLSPATAFIVTQILKDVLVDGTASNLQQFAMDRPAAGKTGTTDDYKDAWFIGYTPQIITGVWVGHDQPQGEGKGFTGGVAAAPIWERFMRTALTTLPPAEFPQPATVVAACVDPDSGKLATAECLRQQDEFFEVGTEPTGYCTEHGGIPACALSNSGQ